MVVFCIKVVRIATSTIVIDTVCSLSAITNDGAGLCKAVEWLRAVRTFAIIIVASMGSAVLLFAAVHIVDASGTLGDAVIRPAIVVRAAEAARNRFAPIAMETNEFPLTFFVYSVTITLAFAERIRTARNAVVADMFNVLLRDSDFERPESQSQWSLHRTDVWMVCQSVWKECGGGGPWEVCVKSFEERKGSIVFNIINNNVTIPT